MRWFLLTILALLALGGGLAACTSKTFHAEGTIAAPPEKVWAVLMDTEAYGDWNPVFVGVDGAYAPDASVLNKVRFPDGRVVEMTAKVEVIETAKELTQSGGYPGLLSFRHQWLLEPVEGGTKVTQYEVDRGIYLWFWDSDWVEPAYKQTIEALKTRVEGSGS